MRKLVKALVSSLPELGNVTIFLGVVFIMFGIIGLQEFNGVMYNKCRTTEAPVNATSWPKSDEYTFVCSKVPNDTYSCPSGMFCGNPREYGISLENDGVYTDETI